MLVFSSFGGSVVPEIIVVHEINRALGCCDFIRVFIDLAAKDVKEEVIVCALNRDMHVAV